MNDLDEERPLEPCIICNKEARDAMDEGARQVTEELIAERPPDCIRGIACWNCLGTGFTGGKPRSVGDYLDAMMKE